MNGFRGCIRAATLALAVLGGVIACDDPEVVSEFEAARARWVEAAIQDYAYTLRRGCFCLPEFIGPVRIVVENGQVASRTLLSTGGEPLGEAERWPTIEGLFDYVERAMREADETTVRYHPDLGYPIEISVDWIRQAVDDEESVGVESFAQSND